MRKNCFNTLPNNGDTVLVKVSGHASIQKTIITKILEFQPESDMCHNNPIVGQDYETWSRNPAGRNNEHDFFTFKNSEILSHIIFEDPLVVGRNKIPFTDGENESTFFDEVRSQGLGVDSRNNTEGLAAAEKNPEPYNWSNEYGIYIKKMGGTRILCPG